MVMNFTQKIYGDFVNRRNMRNEIIKKLKKISAIANTMVPNINYGGCAVMAALVGTELEKLGIEVEGITTDGIPSISRNKNSNSWDGYDWQENGVGFGHVALRFKLDDKVYTYDTDKLHRGSKRFGINLRDYTPTKFGEGLKVKELRKVASTTDGFWNEQFDRRNIPKLRKIVKEGFSSVK